MITENGVLLILFWTGFADLVNSNYIFHTNPRLYIWWNYYTQLNLQQMRSQRINNIQFSSHEVMRVKIRSRQAMVFQSTLDAKIRAQHRDAARSQRRF